MMDKRIALVTGGSRGIGLAIARNLGRDGFSVAIVATRPAEHYPESLEMIESDGFSYRWFAGNVGDTEDRKRIVNEVISEFGAIHVLVNNAGVSPLTRDDLLQMQEKSWDRVLDINLKGNMFMTQLVALQMMTQDPINGKRGTIINISSVSAEVVSTNRGEYCVSKAGISMLTQLFAARLGSEGILVNEVRPGIIKTEMTSTVSKKYDALIEKGLCPISRWGYPEDIARVVSSLCSDSFNYTTGTCIFVDGGMHIPQL